MEFLGDVTMKRFMIVDRKRTVIKLSSLFFIWNKLASFVERERKKRADKHWMLLCLCVCEHIEQVESDWFLFYFIDEHFY